MNLLWTLTWLFLRPLLNFFCDFKVINQHFAKDLQPPCIIAVAMHAHRLDPWIVSAGLPLKNPFFPIHFATAEKYMKMPLLGSFLAFYSAFAVQEGVGAENALIPAVKLLQKGKTVGIFPEGSLARENTLRDGKRGAAYLGHAAGVPILPIAMSGTFNLTFKNFILRRNKITVVFGRPYLVTEPDSIIATQELMTKIKLLYVGQ